MPLCFQVPLVRPCTASAHMFRLSNTSLLFITESQWSFLYVQVADFPNRSLLLAVRLPQSDECNFTPPTTLITASHGQSSLQHLRPWHMPPITPSNSAMSAVWTVWCWIVSLAQPTATTLTTGRWSWLAAVALRKPLACHRQIAALHHLESTCCSPCPRESQAMRLMYLCRLLPVVHRHLPLLLLRLQARLQAWHSECMIFKCACVS